MLFNFIKEVLPKLTTSLKQNRENEPNVMSQILLFRLSIVFIETIHKSKQMPIVKPEDSPRWYIYSANHSKKAETKA